MDVRGVCVTERQEKGLLMWGSGSYQVEVIENIVAAPKNLMQRDQSQSLPGIAKCTKTLGFEERWATDSVWTVVTGLEWHNDGSQGNDKSVSRLAAIAQQDTDEQGWAHGTNANGHSVRERRWWRPVKQELVGTEEWKKLIKVGIQLIL